MKNLRQMLRHSRWLNNEKRHRRSQRPNGGQPRRLSSEALEKRELLAGDFAPAHNYWNRFDVDSNQEITSVDALKIINRLGQQQESLEAEQVGEGEDRIFWDVNADNELTAADALGVINAMGRGEEVGELVEYFITIRDLNDQEILPDGSGNVNVDVGIDNRFKFEVAYDDLRTFGDGIGVFQSFTDTNVSVPGALLPVLNETQRIVVGEEIRTASSGSLIFGLEGSATTYESPLSAFGNDPTAEVANALAAFGYSPTDFSISTLDFGNDDVGRQIKYIGNDKGNVDLPDITLTETFDVAVPTQFIEIAPFEADGVTPNSDAIRFNLDVNSRTFNDNSPFFSSQNRGTFTSADGFDGLGGLGGVPTDGGGVPELANNGQLIEPFDIFSLVVYAPAAATFDLSVIPGTDPEATLLYGRDDAVPSDMVLIDEDATVTVVAGDVGGAAGELSISDAPAVIEGGSAVFTVSRANGSDGAVSVTFTTANGTAIAGSDYDANTGTVTFADGDTANKTITVTTIDDAVPESTETFTVTLSGATGGATIADGSGTGTINDNDQPVGELNIDPTSISVNEDGVSVSVNVVRSGNTSEAASVSFSTANGTAVAGSDYTATSDNLSFAAGVTSQTITVPILDDTVPENTETFAINLTSATNATIGTASSSTVTINDDDAVGPQPGTLSISPATLSVPEGDTGTTTATFTVSRASGSDGIVSVNFATANGTATAGSDYTANSGTVTFADGDTADKTITVSIIGDTADEADETFTVTLSNPTNGALLGTSVSNVTIIDDDGTPPVRGVLSISPATLTVPEGDTGTSTATFTVSRAQGSDGIVAVNFATANGTATAGSDYTANSGTVTFADGDTANKTITVSIIGDTTDEPDETFTVTLSGATGGATLGTTVSNVTIQDDDPPVVGNRAPVGGNVTVQADEDTPITYPASTILRNSSDPDAGDTISIQSVTSPTTASGTAVLNGDGTVSYDPANDFNGSDSFTVTIRDNGGLTDTLVVSVNVRPINDAPIARPDSVDAFLGSTLVIPASTLLANDSAGPADESGQTLSIASVTGAVLNANGSVSFTPTTTGVSTFTYTISDGIDQSAAATVSVTVSDFNPTTVSGSIFIDKVDNAEAIIGGAAASRNGIQDANDDGLGGIPVHLTPTGDTGGDTITTLTGLDGGYAFTNVRPGTYSVSYELPAQAIGGGPTSSPITIGPDGGVQTVPSVALDGLGGAALNSADILVSSYLRANPEMAASSNNGREGGTVGLDSDGVQNLFVAKDGFDGVEFAELALSKDSAGNIDGEAALLTVIKDGQALTARLSSNHFVISRDQSAVQFFGGVDDFDFVEDPTDILDRDFPDFFDTINRANNGNVS